MQEHEFTPDDLVSHKIWGIGLVKDVITDPEPSIIIDFPDKPKPIDSINKYFSFPMRTYEVHPFPFFVPLE